MADIHVLLVYSLSERKLISHREFSADEQDEAFSEYATAEAEHRGLGDVEIVLVAADSMDTIRHTHGSYFREDVTSLDTALEALLSGTSDRPLGRCAQSH